MWTDCRCLGTRVAAGALAVALAWSSVAASEFELSINNGRVTIRAQDALITDILAEWGRVGRAVIIDADQLGAETVTLELVDVPEAQALRTLLRSASGFMAAPRAAMSAGVSRFDRILILASSKPAARGATVASPGRAPVSAPRVSGGGGQRLGVVPSAQSGQTPFTVSPAQQEQLDQLQQLLQQPDDTDGGRQQPADARRSINGVPVAGIGGQGTVGITTGVFGSTIAAEDTSSPPSPTRRNPNPR